MPAIPRQRAGLPQASIAAEAAPTQSQLPEGSGYACDGKLYFLPFATGS
ncbi:hypothetical protein FHS47_003523 [Lutibacter sp. SG786]|nr:hypothetical protein [Luteibacter sp. SG786]